MNSIKLLSARKLRHTNFLLRFPLKNISQCNFRENAHKS